MLYSAHYSHLHVHLLIKDSILHKPSLFEFLCSVWSTIEFSCDFVNDSKGALAKLAGSVVFIATFPLPYLLSKGRKGRKGRSSGSGGREEVYLSLVNNQKGVKKR